LYFTKLATGISINTGPLKTGRHHDWYKHQYRAIKNWKASGTKQYSEERTLTDPENCIYNTHHKMKQLHYW
jgi:hypothetical protein